MSMIATAYGRLGKAPRAITTASGKPMASASIAVDLRTKRDPDAAHWLPLLAFGPVADTLLSHHAGECIAVSGRLQRNAWTGKDGAERVDLQMVVDTVTSARTVRPGAKRATKPPEVRDDYRTLAQPAEDFDDATPF